MPRHSLLALLLVCFAAFAQERSVAPGVNRAYEQADYARWRSSFESEGREIFEQRHAIVDALKLAPGMVVADVGAGTGVLSMLFAQRVGASGTVIAQDVVPEFLRGIEERARREGLPQVKTQLGAEKDARLPANGVDLVFTSDAYHHFEYPRAMLASLHRALKPGGRLIVIDYEKIPGRTGAWVMGHVRAGRETVIAEVTEAGFELARSYDLLRENYFLEFRRP